MNNYLTDPISNFGSNWGQPNYETPDFGFDTQSLMGITPPVGQTPIPAGSGGGGNWWDGMLGKTQNGVTTQGWGGTAINAVSALGSAYLGMKQYGLAKETLKHNKDMFTKNFDAQRRTTNASLRDRQAARVASNPGAYQSVSDYMQQNEVR